MLELTLPWPPSVNHYKRPGPLKRSKAGNLYQLMINTPETNRYYFQVHAQLQHLRATQPFKSFQDSTISLEVYAYPPDKRKRDIDGILKVLFDSLEKARIFNDDYQISRLLVVRKDIIKHGKVIVKISALE